MVNPRTQDSSAGAPSEQISAEYDKIMRTDRDKGILYTVDIIKSGIDEGSALELGPGPGYLGLEWLKRTTGTVLTGLDISEWMVKIAEKNALDYGFSNERVKYIKGDAHKLPFSNESFENVFSNAFLHELADPVKALNEIHRVLKTGGRYYISDLRRDMNPVFKFIMKKGTKNKELVDGLISSINASYTKKEAEELMRKSNLSEYKITSNPFSIFIKGIITQ
jgi:ubiquinone/menaquinone biosynthesis C-methylase UbiE